MYAFVSCNMYNTDLSDETSIKKERKMLKEEDLQTNFCKIS